MPTLAATKPLRHLAGLLLAAAWLGWTVAALAALARPAGADATELARLADQLRVLHPALGQGRPLAVRLAGCACAAGNAGGSDDRQWRRVDAVLAGSGGQLVSSTLSAAWPLLVFDARGEPVYAGPLPPPASACGRRDAAADDWLPPLLDATQPPLLLPAPCTCRD